MDIPTQEDIDKCKEVMEYFINDMEQYEPYAVSTIASFNDTLRNIPEADDIEVR